jgi:hypothetical protein
LEQETTTQREIPLPQDEIEVDPTQITEVQTSQAVTKTKKRKMPTPKSPTRTRKRSRQTQEATEEIEDATEHPEEFHNVMEQPLWENVQEIEQAKQITQKGDQGDTQPALKYLRKHFFKSYEIEMAQVLGNLGTSTDKGKNNLEKDLELGSSSRPVEDFPETEMSFPDDTTQEEFIFEERNPLEQT